MSKPATTDLRALWATTKENISKVLAKNILGNIPLLTEIKDKGNMKEVVGGGRDFNEPAIVGDSDAVGGYKKGSLLNVSEQTGIDDFEYSNSFFYGSVFMDGTELAMNAGDAKAIDLMQARLEQAQDSMANKLDEYLCGTNQLDGAASSSNAGSQFGWLGLQDLVPDTATQDIPGTGISKLTYAKARSYVSSTAIATAAAFNTALAGRIVMNDVFDGSRYGVESPTLCLMTRSIYDAFQTTLQNNERYEMSSQSDTGKVGFKALLFMGNCRVFFGSNVKAGHFYMLNPKYMKLKILRDKNWKVSDFVPAYDQDCERSLITLGGQFTVNGPKFHGVWTGGAF